MKNKRFALILLCLLVIIPGTVLGDEQEGQLLCDSSDPICQKFKQMLELQKGETKFMSRQEGEEQIPCDKSDPICQKFQEMLEDQARDEQNHAALRVDNENEYTLDCDWNDPICQKFQGMLQQQQTRNEGTGAESGGQGKCIQWLCMLKGKTCYTNGTCGDLVGE